MAPRLAGGSRAVIERAPALTDTPETRARLETFSVATGIPLDELLARTDPPDPADVLRAAGWIVDEVSVGDLETRYSRPLAIEDRVVRRRLPRRLRDRASARRRLSPRPAHGGA